jgi:hypothetical protein
MPRYQFSNWVPTYLKLEAAIAVAPTVWFMPQVTAFGVVDLTLMVLLRTGRQCLSYRRDQVAYCATVATTGARTRR